MIRTSVEGDVYLLNDKVQLTEKFAKRNIIIQTISQYNPHVSIDFINDKISLLDNIKQGDAVKIYVDVFSRQSNKNPNQYFNNITGWKIETIHSAIKTEQPAEIEQDDEIPDELPFWPKQTHDQNRTNLV